MTAETYLLFVAPFLVAAAGLVVFGYGEYLLRREHRRAAPVTNSRRRLRP